MNVSVPGIVESNDAPAVAERRAAALASAMNVGCNASRLRRPRRKWPAHPPPTRATMTCP